MRREAYGWIRWNDVSSCEVVGGENALKSSGFISISGIAENSLEILFLFNFKQDISGPMRTAQARQNRSFCLKFKKKRKPSRKYTMKINLKDQNFENYEMKRNRYESKK